MMLSQKMVLFSILKVIYAQDFSMLLFSNKLNKFFFLPKLLETHQTFLVTLCRQDLPSQKPIICLPSLLNIKLPQNQEYLILVTLCDQMFQFFSPHKLILSISYFAEVK